MKTRVPNAFLYFIVYIIAYPFLKICFRMKVDKKGLGIEKGKPYIVLANHATMLDFLIAMLPLYPRRLNAVTARKFFYHSPLHILLPLAGCIPKNLFDPDVRSIVGIKTVLQRGSGVIIFPEGRCSHSRAYAGIHISTGKLIKKLGVPVISCYIEGAANCLALWRKGMRFGRIRVTYRTLFTEENLKEMDAGEINNAIDLRLSGAEGTVPPRKPFETFKAKRLAEGLEKLLYLCPACRQEFAMATENNRIYCRMCGFSATLTRTGMFEYDNDAKTIPKPGNIPSWHAMQLRYETERLSEDMQPVEVRAALRMPGPKNGGGLEERGRGTLRITPAGWSYEGKCNGEDISIFFPVDTVPAINDDSFRNVQFFDNGNFYEFIPEDPRMCIKCLIIAECLHRKFAKTPLLTQNAV